MSFQKSRTRIISTPISAATPANETVALIAGYKIANRGRSPLWIVTEGIDWFWTPLPVPTDKPYPPQSRPVRLPRDPLMPGEQREGFGENIVLTPDQRGTMLRQEAAVIVYGLVVYRDAFEKLHETGFCWIYQRFALPVGWDATTNDWGEQLTGWEQSLWILMDGPEEYIRHT